MRRKCWRDREAFIERRRVSGIRRKGCRKERLVAKKERTDQGRGI